MTRQERVSGPRSKLDLIRDAFLHGKIIAGSVQGCGSSNINKLHQFAIAHRP